MARRARQMMSGLGFVIGLVALAALLWNEWRLAQRFAALDAVEAAQVDGAAADAPFYGSGDASAAGLAGDPVFGVTAAALRLDRTAQTHQWRETREGSGDNKTLRYERVWSPVLIDSRRFERRMEHANPPALPAESRSFFAPDPRLDGLRLSEELVAALPATRELRPELDGTLAGPAAGFRREGDWLYSGDPAAPRVGDLRLRFAAAPPGRVSVVAALDGDRLRPYRAPNGVELALAAYGDVPLDQLLAQAARADWREAWAMRGFGTLVLFVALLVAAPGMPWLAARRGRQRLGIMILTSLGLAALAGAAGWAGARLLAAMG